MRVLPKRGRETAQLVTEARKPRSEDIAYRERRYLMHQTAIQTSVRTVRGGVLLYAA